MCGCVICFFSLITAVFPPLGFTVVAVCSIYKVVSCQCLPFLTTLQNGRTAKLLTVGVRQLGDKRPSSFSRCCALVRYDAAKLASDSFAIIKSLNMAGNHQAAW